MAELPNDKSSGWLQPPEEREGLQRYVETLRERVWLIAVVVAITTVIAILYVATTAKTYDAEADLLITPVSGDDPVLTSLGLISASADPTRDVETASRLVTNIDVADGVVDRLHSSESAQSLLDKVSAVPVAGSNIVAVTASAGSPADAQDLANAFAAQAVADRTDQMHSQINRQLDRLQAQAGTGGGAVGATGTSIDSQIAELQVLSTAPDPTIRVQTQAPLPSGPSSPKPVLSIIGGIFAGLILGIGAAFTSQALDPRLRREAQLRRLYKLPILCRIPKEPNSGERPIGPDRVSPVVSEGYRSLRATLTGMERSRDGNVVLVTGSSASEGKTTTAVNLAASLALAGKRVILIESDLRHPVLGGVLKVKKSDRGGVVSVLIENRTLDQALVPSDTYGPNLQLLLADYEGGWIADLFSIPSAEQMIEDARRLADYVIIDSPPLNEVVDALPLARKSDAVLLIARIGVTRLDKLGQLAELLAENGVTPAGFALLGTPRPGRGESHYYAEKRESRAQELRRRVSSSAS